LRFHNAYYYGKAKENEVSGEWFFKLKEFDSLEKMRIGYLKQIQEQEERLARLNIKRQEQLDAQAGLTSDLHQLQQAYFETEKKLKTCEEQSQRLKDVGGDEEKIKRFQTEAGDLENLLFEMLDKTEQIQVGLNDIKTFLTGLEKTTQEISSEAQTDIQEKRLEMTQIELRLKLIKEELPVEFKDALEKTLKKNLAVGPFTRIENGCCFFCRYKISRMEESEIDMQKALKFCPQCLRIFLPYGS
jgi:predicted  nucleic acid-binding Zn-ribbon protein